MTMAKIGAVATAFAAFCVAVAAADTALAESGRAKLDANGDGFVDRGEVTARGDQIFTELDKDRDHSLSIEELAGSGRKRVASAAVSSTSDGSGSADVTRRTERAAKRLDRLDRDGDGKVSLEEFNGSRLARFERLDKDRDGKLSPDERARRRASG